MHLDAIKTISMRAITRAIDELCSELSIDTNTIHNDTKISLDYLDRYANGMLAPQISHLIKLSLVYKKPLDFWLKPKVVGPAKPALPLREDIPLTKPKAVYVSTEVGARVERAFRASGVMGKAMAHYIGVTPHAFSKMINPPYRMTDKDKDKILDVLDKMQSRLRAEPARPEPEPLQQAVLDELKKLSGLVSKMHTDLYGDSHD